MFFAITSNNLLLLIFLFPINVIEEILVSKPLFTSNIKSIFSSISLNLASTVAKLNLKVE